MSISFKNLSLGYGKKTILKDVTLDLPQGKITALLGPNGCGKSTLLKAIIKILKPVNGEVHFQGKNIESLTSKYISQKLAFLPQVQPIPEGITVKTLVSYGRSPYTNFWGSIKKSDKSFIQEVMKEVGVLDLQDSFISELSGGQRQRAWLAMVLAQDTSFILLDEPTTYMDINHQIELMCILRRLNKKGKTIIVVLHDINQAARYCDHLVLLKEGKVVSQGSTKEIMNKKLLKEVFDIKAQIHLDPIAKCPMLIVEE